MQENVLDDYGMTDENGLSLYARDKAAKTGFWMVLSAACVLFVIAFVSLIIFSEGGWKVLRHEEIAAEIFLMLMAIKYILVMLKGIRLRRAVRQTGLYALEKSAPPYHIAWVIGGIGALVFFLGMILYLTARIELFGEISEMLFRIDID